MSGQDAPYDPYIPSGQGGAPQQQQGGNNRTQALQALEFWFIPVAYASPFDFIRLDMAVQQLQYPLIRIFDECAMGDVSVYDTKRKENNNTGLPRNERQIDDTVGVMRENINKVSQRGERLDALQDKTDNLAVSAQGFRRGANRVRKQMWWKDMKMRMCIIIGIIILLVIIIVPSVIFGGK
ncbi:hypothetical protein EKO27_g3021 [Xylaria grammica]|uniref:V-SNARE coiled-coil homology domain-containing protein n=1 Tax=Xylaria grammica TaxID=363999 RepID=A0A439DCI3_9PEZI|nr:hypothetical protein EKO27_g3021 [Xylaria grammica]